MKPFVVHTTTGAELSFLNEAAYRRAAELVASTARGEVIAYCALRGVGLFRATGAILPDWTDRAAHTYAWAEQLGKAFDADLF